MAVNKVVMNTESGEKVLMDLTTDTVTPDTLAEGATAHDASGNQITGRMTAGGGSGGVQPDWAQTDETQPDFIRNKPFGEEKGYSDTLTVAKTVEELEEIINSGQLAGGSFYKVSDSVVRMSDLGNGFVLDLGGEILDFSADEANEAAIEIFDGVLSLADMFFIVDENAVGVDLEGLVFPEKGVYINVYILFESPYISLAIPGFQFATTVVTKIEEKFIPANIARTSSIVQSDWAQTDETQPDFIRNKPAGKYIIDYIAENGQYKLLDGDKHMTFEKFAEIVDTYGVENLFVGDRIVHSQAICARYWGLTCGLISFYRYNDGSLEHITASTKAEA